MATFGTYLLSEECIRCKLFKFLTDPPDEVRVRYCNINYDRQIAIVAEPSEENPKRILEEAG